MAHIARLTIRVAAGRNNTTKVVISVRVRVDVIANDVYNGLIKVMRMGR
jgi:hypothetical protein